MISMQFQGKTDERNTCVCRRCIKDDPGGCLVAEGEAVWADQVRRGVITADTYFIAKDENGVAL